jgi:hypothetical protein
MPQEEVFLEIQAGSDAIRVVKTYDTAFAKECYSRLDESSLRILASSLRLLDNYEVADIPADSDEDYADFLWQELFDSAREDGQVRSFFVVTRTAGSRAQPLYVSGDWPSAESCARQLQLAVAK